jgi:ribosome-binding factor A
MKDGGRGRRVEAQLQRALAELLPRTVKDPRVGSVTITAVKLTPDMGEARVYFLPFGRKHSAEEALRGLNSASGLLRGVVGRELSMRHAPRLQFFIDEQLERAHELTTLIDHAVDADRTRAAAHPAAAADQAPEPDPDPES